jgi:hypothetical protein
MPTTFESATLNLKLFDLRREPVLRDARQWFLADFNPESFAELAAIAGGPQNAAFRMVLGYWDMAASLVTAGAIEADAFRAAHGEIFLTLAKVYPFLSELRIAAGEPEFCRYIEAVVLGAPDAEAIMTRRRASAIAAAKARATNPRPQAG